VLVEGAKIFRKKGYSASTTRELAAQLGINKASLYYHMQKKEDLLYAICIESMRRIYEEVAEAVGTVDDPLERIRALVNAHLRSTLTDLDMHATMMLEMKNLSGDYLNEVVSARNRYEGLVGETVAAAQRAGALRQDTPANYLRIVLLNLLNWPLTWYEKGMSMTPEKLSAVSYDLYVNGAHAR